MSSQSAPVAKRASNKKASPAAAAAPIAAPVAAASVPVVAPVAAAVISHVETAPVVAEENVNIVAQFSALTETVNTLRSTLSTVFSAMKKLEKQIPRELKKAGKGRRRRAATVDADGAPVEAKPTVFTTPTLISDALATFLGEAKGSKLKRSEVTTRVCKYARDHNLMDKQFINADAPLRKLLGLKESDQLKILNLQRYLAPHYPEAKAKKAAAAAAATATASAAPVATATPSRKA